MFNICKDRVAASLHEVVIRSQTSELNKITFNKSFAKIVDYSVIKVQNIKYYKFYLFCYVSIKTFKLLSGIKRT